MANQATARRRASSEFTLISFMWRLIGALALILATYNPTQYSYFHWARNAFSEGTLGPEHYFVGVVLLIGWAILVVATRSALGTLGVVLGIALLGTAVWLLIDLGVLHPDSVSAMTWIALVCLAIFLAIGLSWSHLWRRLTGQFDVVEDDR